jgi:hypothetical protein
MFAGQPPAEGDDRRSLRPQRFDSLEAALAAADIELRRAHRLGVATIIYAARTHDDRGFRGSAELRSVDPSGGGYIPGTLSGGEYILQPIFVFRSTRAVELHILVPGYERFLRRAILRDGDMLVWDDILLDPLTARTTGSIGGRVWLEDENEELGGIVISVDGEAAAFADDAGYFVLDRVRGGKVTVAATTAGYTSLTEEVEVVPGRQEACLLRGFRRRFAPLRWAYQPDGTRVFDRNVQAGEAVLTAGRLQGVTFGRCFAQSDARSELFVVQKADRLVVHFGAGPERSAALRMAGRSMGEIHEVPESGYTQSPWTLRPGDLVAFRCHDGAHYAMMEVIEITDRQPTNPETGR